MYRKLFALLRQGIVVLTVNHRLSFYLQQQFDNTLWNEKNEGTAPPLITSIDQWLATTWGQQLQHGEHLITDFQATLLWQKIIQENDTPPLTIPVKPTALLAKKAWETLKQWGLSLSDIKSDTRSQTQTFITWAEQFEKRLAQQQWLCMAELPHRLKNLLEENQWLPPKELIFVGFNEFSPALTSLINALKKKISVTLFEPTLPTKATVQRLSLPTAESEIIAAANWAQQVINANNTPVRVGILFFNLSQAHTHISRQFRKVFETTNKPLPFNIAAPSCFSQILMIQTALRLLHISQPPLKLEDLDLVFHSPYLNSDTIELAYASQLHAALSCYTPNNVLHKKVASHFASLNNIYPEATFPKRWASWLECLKQDDIQLPSQWAAQFKIELDAIGWPGQRKLDTQEYQWLMRWNALLEELNTLDTLVGKIPRQPALTLLNQLSEHTRFQTKSNEQAPIQVMDLLESAGQLFDYLWVAGFTNEAWPAPAKPNPFLPISLQRKENMPHASARREFIYAERMQERLVKSANNIFFSYATSDKERSLEASSLIEKYPAISLPLLGVDTKILSVKQLFESSALEHLIDNQGPPLQKNETLRGGKSILQNQADCPFRAFSKIRLHAENPQEGGVGLSPIEHGLFIHEALDQFWKQVKNQKQLKNYSDREIKEIIASITENIINREENQTLFLKVEKKRLNKILQNWVELEKERPDFTVSQRETSRFIQIGNLSIRLTIDRIDTLSETEGNFIVDYKAKREIKTKDWFGDRPKELQLPLYCVYASANPIGIAYAQLHANKVVFKGFSTIAFSEIKPITKTKWENMILEWKKTLENLATQFSSGIAHVDPSDPEETCRYCDLQNFCRI